MKKLFLFIFFLTFFSFLIFILGNYFFWDLKQEININIENTYIEPSIIKNEYVLDNKVLTEEVKDKIRVSLKSAYNINFIYFPEDFKLAVLDYTDTFKSFLNHKSIIWKIDDLKIEFHKEKNDVRWKMKDHSIKLFWVGEMKLSECNAVWIHEFAHYIDLYFFKKHVFTDISDYFYNISWESTKVIKSGLIQADFVSGYAMTNKYEDFAETFTYFIIHNDDFLEKTKESDILKSKYDFLNKYLFKNNEFVWSDFSINNIIEPYYRDITKINFSLENFLEFLKNGV